MTSFAESPLARPGFFQRFSEGEAQRLNTLVGESRPFAFPWAGENAALRFTPLADAPAANFFLRVRLDDHSFDLGLAQPPEPSALGPIFAGIECSELPPDLFLGVLEAWLDEPVHALKAHGISLQFETWHQEAPLTPACVGWAITRDDEAQFLSGTLHAETDALNHLANLATRLAPQARTAGDTVPLSLQVVLSQLALPLATLTTLQPGDVLFPPLTPASRRAGLCELCYRGAPVAQARLNANTLEILTMKASAETKLTAAASLRVDELPVAVAFDVGQLDLTVGQLRTIGAGYMFTLPAEPSRLVTLRANGREIGHGELVELGDKIGVRIVDWSLT